MGFKVAGLGCKVLKGLRRVGHRVVCILRAFSVLLHGLSASEIGCAALGFKFRAQD